ncbi:MAG: biotin/lipoyl-binding protein [Hyphomicrobiales bacterium]|nr:biotin/lipoyl-binding protein [Hyphomicrobiales bacterium]
MGRWLIGILLFVLLAVGGFFAYQSSYLTPGNSGETTSLAAAKMDAASDVHSSDPDPGEVDRTTIVADARLLPIQRAELSFAVSGIVEEVLVREGELVAAGQLLVRLKANQQQAAVSQAQALLLRAEAQLRQLIAPPRTQEVIAAEATLQAATARYERLAQAALPGEIAAAEASVNVSQATLAKVLEGASEQQLIAARADLADAKARADEHDCRDRRRGAVDAVHTGPVDDRAAVPLPRAVGAADHSRPDRRFGHGGPVLGVGHRHRHGVPGAEALEPDRGGDDQPCLPPDQHGALGQNGTWQRDGDDRALPLWLEPALPHH